MYDDLNWFVCKHCGYLIDTPNHNLGCAWGRLDSVLNGLRQALDPAAYRDAERRLKATLEPDYDSSGLQVY